MEKSLPVVMVGATGAVGGQAARALAAMAGHDRLRLLGRRAVVLFGGWRKYRGIALGIAMAKSLLTGSPPAWASLMRTAGCDPSPNAATSCSGVFPEAKPSSKWDTKLDKHLFASVVRKATPDHHLGHPFRQNRRQPMPSAEPHGVTNPRPIMAWNSSCHWARWAARVASPGSVIW